MKPNYLLTSMLAVATIVVTSCSAPKMAQQNTINDDVYNSTAQAKAYVAPVPRQDDGYDRYDNSEDDGYGYGSSDPYYDMDYSSRINRFNYGSPFRSYYDPFYSPYGYGGFGGFGGFGGYPFYGSGFSIGLGFGTGFGWGNSFYSPYGWNSFYDPFWGFNNYYGGAFGGFYGGGYGGFYGGGYYGGGYYGGGRFVNNTPRPNRGRENGVGYARPNYGSQNGRSTTSRTSNGVTTYGERRGDRSTTTTGTNSTRQGRTESYNPPQQSRPTYSPPASYGGGRGESGGGGSMGGGGGGSRGGRGGRN